jgi:serine/threonine protein kinase
MVPYIYATELPTCAVMPFIGGPNLNKAVQQGLLRDWDRLLSVATRIADTLVRAHGLEERVYHRDLRPANVMIENGYDSDDTSWRVVLLDFDLSWHKGAVEQSIVQEGQVSGYLAPEQVETNCRYSTRNALVDSFGLGMLLRFLRTEQAPRHMEHRYGVWIDEVSGNIGKFSCNQWHSLPFRFSRLILSATKNEQPDRWDMTSIRDELFRLNSAIGHPEKVFHIDMLAEELCCRIAETIQQRYHWDDALVRAVISFSSGLEMVIERHDEEQCIQCKITWIHKGDQTHRSIRKYLPDRLREFQASCERSGWRVLSPLIVDSGSDHASGCLIAGAKDVNSKMPEMARTIGEGLSRLQL